jgi:hypothetical protein
MENTLDKLKTMIEDDIRNLIERFNTLLDNLSDLSSSDINNKLWKLRADLELLIIEIKFFLGKEDKTERWQTTFKNDLKGTSSRQKAEKNLEEYRVDGNKVIEDFEKKPETIYRYLWKLKESISSVLSAFPVDRIDLFNGEIKETSEDVFEI